MPDRRLRVEKPAPATDAGQPKDAGPAPVKDAGTAKPDAGPADAGHADAGSSKPTLVDAGAPPADSNAAGSNSGSATEAVSSAGTSSDPSDAGPRLHSVKDYLRSSGNCSIARGAASTSGAAPWLFGLGLVSILRLRRRRAQSGGDSSAACNAASQTSPAWRQAAREPPREKRAHLRDLAVAQR